ncbi:MAG TPA: hypothetical protein PLK13_18660 [Xanthobacteraceae bacterium]|jgi:hypothetical protein|uniref:hypothetical protein n=1 Tax=Roseixanthobacter finlandensis TaxID=3119922 RepID=UPI000BD953EC|nr:MAG: hypothetical protein B7Z41_08985 [Rhizobiales bacterium 12-66-7]OYY86174.1 MAG: hypothetical protein B7Y61_06785 [Rhizobiales bacterium 35-66-30]OZB03434.1 MAG: hypothetical protein B7X67_17040 [Rhizobiales bacterium 39-66-18]HQS10850.1 hypothetical protein [Xanthobacteraceae bacterium]
MDENQRSSAGAPGEADSAATFDDAFMHMAALRQQPGFVMAVDQAMRGLLGMYRGHLLPNRILNDRGRLALALCTLYLHHEPDRNGVGLTVTRLTNLCQDTGICSRGRAKAMILLMRWAGFLEVGRTSDIRAPSGRTRPLVPTQRLVDEQTRRWLILSGALARLDPLGGLLLTGLENPGFFGALIRQLGRRYVAGIRLLDTAPAIALFADRDGGLMMAFLLAKAANDALAAGSEASATVSISALARGCNVSRAHVLKLVREAEAEGLLRRLPGPEGGILATSALHAGIEDFFAAAFSVLMCSGRDALAEMEARTQQEADTIARPPLITTPLRPNCGPDIRP